MLKHKKSPHATVTDFLQVTAAIHLSSFVDSPFKDRGGVFLVGPPGALKSTIVEFLEKSFSDALVLSDINVQTLVKLKERIAGGNIRTLVMSELGKIYERHSSVASNIEGHLRALAGEGFHSASFEDATISRLKARATIIGGMTGQTRELHASKWDDSGFARRFLWSLIVLRDPAQLERAVVNGKLIKIAQTEAPRVGPSGSIPDLTTKTEREKIAHWCKYQPMPHNIQIAILVKAWAVMKWWARQSRRSENTAWQTLERFALSLGKNGVEVVVQ
jgi:hypothetical protein